MNADTIKRSHCQTGLTRFSEQGSTAVNLVDPDPFPMFRRLGLLFFIRVYLRLSAVNNRMRV
jgi:hypothetical protein